MSTHNRRMTCIAYGEPSSIRETLLVGSRYCSRHLKQVPRMTKAEVVRAGGVFPGPTSQRPVGRPKKIGGAK